MDAIDALARVRRRRSDRECARAIAITIAVAAEMHAQDLADAGAEARADSADVAHPTVPLAERIVRTTSSVLDLLRGREVRRPEALSAYVQRAIVDGASARGRAKAMHDLLVAVRLAPSGGYDATRKMLDRSAVFAAVKQALRG